MQPLFVLSGATQEKRTVLLESLLLRLEEKSIKTLVICSGRRDERARQHFGKSLWAHSDLYLPGNMLPQDSRDAAEFFQTLNTAARPLLCQYDLVLCDDTSRDGGDEVVFWGGDDCLDKPFMRHLPADDAEVPAHYIHTYLQRRVEAVPVWSCLLIGGRSSRMGCPKHLIKDRNGLTWVERTVSLLQEQTAQVVLAGRGDVPPSLAGEVRLHDIPTGQGPLAGILAAMRWNPDVNWIVAACDMPLLSRQGLSWLLSLRKPGIWASVPRQPRSNRLEPLLAYYDAHSRLLFETLLGKGDFRIAEVCKHPKTDTPMLPSSLAKAWRNCNSPDDVDGLQ